MSALTANEIIQLYQMEPLYPEGGFFRETYKSERVYENLPPPFKGPRSYSTAIYFLLPKGVKSAFHRIASDEGWHFYLGGPMTLVQISPEGKLKTIPLGQNIRAGEVVQHVVPGGYWFGAYPNEGTEFSFVGCTVAPGFDYADFEMGKRNELLREFPQHKHYIEALTD